MEHTGASKDWITCKLTIVSIKKEKVKDPFLLTISAKFESNAVLEDSGQIIHGKVVFEKVTPEAFEDLKKHFGGLSDLTPLSCQFRRVPGALLSDYGLEAEGD